MACNLSIDAFFQERQGLILHTILINSLHVPEALINAITGRNRFSSWMRFAQSALWQVQKAR